MNIVINNTIYIMPMGKLNKEVLDDLVNNNVINIDELQDNYSDIKRVFDLLCRTVTMFNDYDDPIFKDKIQSLCTQMWRVDSLINFLAQNNHYEKAIQHMKEFMVSMLEPFQNVEEKRQVK